MNFFTNVFHWNYLVSQINLDIFYDFIYIFIFYYDVLSTKLLLLFSYSHMLSDLAEGFAISIILVILLTSSILISIRAQEHVKTTSLKNYKLFSYKTIFTFFK